ELSAVRVRSGVCHRQNARLRVLRLRMKFIGELVAGPAGALPEWIATLNHEPVDHAMEDRAVVVRRGALLARARIGPLRGAFGESSEVRDRLRREIVEQLDAEVAFTRREMRVQHCVCSPACDLTGFCTSTSSPIISSAATSSRCFPTDEVSHRT